jgi:hypothetical protein
VICYLQVTSLKEEIARVREVLANTENSSAEEIKEQYSELQQKSLKLFEMAYKKVRLLILLTPKYWLHGNKSSW